MIENLTQLRDDLDRQGFFAEINSRGRLMCATRRSPEGHGQGCAMLVQHVGGQWYVLTYSPRTYRVPGSHSVAAVVAAVLERDGDALYDFSQEIKARFGLEEVTPEDIGLTW